MRSHAITRALLLPEELWRYELLTICRTKIRAMTDSQRLSELELALRASGIRSTHSTVLYTKPSIVRRSLN
jgi:hypothetical protein